MRKSLAFILNFPWTVLGLMVAAMSIPTQCGFRSGRAIVFWVRRIWLPELYLRRRVRGLTLGNTILMQKDVPNEQTVRHELVHVQQFEKYPFVFPLMYLFQLLKHGYWDNSYEKEARAKAGQS